MNCTNDFPRSTLHLSNRQRSRIRKNKVQQGTLRIDAQFADILAMTPGEPSAHETNDEVHVHNSVGCRRQSDSNFTEVAGPKKIHFAEPLTVEEAANPALTAAVHQSDSIEQHHVKEPTPDDKPTQSSNVFRDDYLLEHSDDESSCTDDTTSPDKLDPDMVLIKIFTDKYKSEYYDHERNNTKLLLNAIGKHVNDAIAFWHVDETVAASKSNKLLHLLRTKIPIVPLGRDIRTLIKTPRHTPCLMQIEGGEYCHFGLQKCVARICDQRRKRNITNTDIKLVVNIDGAPVGKSSSKSIWPILCSESNSNDVYIVGIYCGKSKPSNADEFLRHFVAEAVDVVNNNFVFDSVTYTVSVYALILDAPAKAFLLNIKGHSGYDSCTKCEIEGYYGSRNVCFPGECKQLRSDAQFNKVKYDKYQKGNTILNDIPKLGLVTNVPLDPMHLLYLGVIRRILFILMFATKMIWKLSAAILTDISARLLSYRQYIPYEFARRPRELSDIKFFKATEFRQFGLYTGVLALKSLVAPPVYDNFVVLHVAITILSNPYLFAKKGYVDYAEQLLRTFVEGFQALYGKDYVTHNIHNLHHLSQDCRTYGTLENFSAFKFENYLGRIKNMLRKGQHTLQQLQRRFEELEAMDIIRSTIASIDLEATHEHHNSSHKGSFNINNQYKKLKGPLFQINIDDDKNNCILIDNNVPVEVCNIVTDIDNSFFIIGKPFQVIGNLYTVPLPSSKLGIHVVRHQQCELQQWSVNDISAKLFKLPYGSSDFVTFPILHTYTSPHITQ